MSDLTQFRAEAFDLPLAWRRNPFVGILVQFKSFAYQHARFIKRAVLAELIRGNPRPFIFFFGIAPWAIGEVVADLKSAVYNRDRPWGLERYLENLASIGAIGIAYDLFMSARRRKALEAIAGPAVTDVARVIEAVAGGKPQELARVGLRGVNVLAPITSYTILIPREKKTYGRRLIQRKVRKRAR